MPNFFNKYPYTDFHELNLDWIINAMKKLEIEFDEFKVVNNITFSGQWDITKQYPAWTIVNDNNIGYVSIKPVPVGIVLTNTNYWAEVIDYSAQIAGMQNRIVALENEDIVINGKINTINATLDDITSREIVLLGDSYGVDADAGGTSWASFIETWFSNLTIYRNTIGGTGFASDLLGPDNNLSMLQSLTIPDPDKVKDIVILGGANDANIIYDGYGNETILRNRINAFMNYCKNNFPNAVVKVGFIGWRSVGSVLPTYINTAKIYQSEVEKHDNARYYNAGEVIMHDLSFMNNVDKIHPNQDGSDKLALFAASVINNSEFNYVADYSYDNLTPNAGSIINGQTHYDILFNQDNVTLSMLGEASGGYIDFRSSSTITYNHNMCSITDIVTPPHMPFGLGRNFGYVTVPGIVGVTGVGAKKCTVLILYQNNALSIRAFNADDISNGTTIANILVPPFSITLPTRLN